MRKKILGTDLEVSAVGFVAFSPLANGFLSGKYNAQRNSIDVYTSAGYMLRIDCQEAEKNLITTPGSECALTSLAVDEPLEYVKLYLDGNLQMWVDAEDSRC